MVRIQSEYVAFVCVVAISTIVFGGEQKPVVCISVSKDRFITNEPVGIVIDVSNPTDLTFAMDEKYLWHEFTVSSKTLKVGAVEVHMGSIGLLFGPRHLVQLKPNQRWKKTIYLQRFSFHPLPDLYTVRFGIDIDFAPQNNSFATLSNKGQLSFTVEAADQKKQREMVIAITDRILKGRNPKDAEEAADELCAIDDSIVISQLAKVLEECKNDKIHGYIAWAARKFADSRSAFGIVDDVLGGRSTEISVIQALMLLYEWKIRLSLEQVQKIRDKGDDRTQAMLEKYLEMIQLELTTTH